MSTSQSKSVVVFQKDFEGWESLQDFERDLSEAIQSEYNPQAGVLDGEFEGTLTVTMTYAPK